MQCAPNAMTPEWIWSKQKNVMVNKNFVEYVKIDDKKDSMGVVTYSVVATVHSRNPSQPVTCILHSCATFQEAREWMEEHLK